MPDETWSNLDYSLSLGDHTSSGNFSTSDLLTPNKAIIFYPDLYDESVFPAHIQQLTFTRTGDVLCVAWWRSTPFEGQVVSPGVGDSLLASDYVANQDHEQPFTLQLVDNPWETFAYSLTRMIYLTRYATSIQQANVLQVVGAADYTPPTITITAPVNGQRWSNAVFTVKGAARDNQQVSNVWFQINNSEWQLAATKNHWTNWTATVTLIPGTNTVQGYAEDTSGNVSTTNTVRIIYVLRAALAGHGTGSISTNSTELAPGAHSLVVESGVRLVAGLKGNEMLLTLQADSGRSYVVQSSGDLLSWTNVMTLVPVGGVIQTTQPMAGGKMFYRAAATR